MRLSAIAILALGLNGCDNSDVGDPCTGMKVPVEGGATSEGDLQTAHGSEIVEYNAEFPCSSTVCVATLGHGAFCSIECSDDDGCPQAFTCRQVLTDVDKSLLPEGAVEMLEQQYCVWRECTKDDECGSDVDYACAKIEELSLGGDVVRMCAPR